MHRKEHRRSTCDQDHDDRQCAKQIPASLAERRGRGCVLCLSTLCCENFFKLHARGHHWTSALDGLPMPRSCIFKLLSGQDAGWLYNAQRSFLSTKTPFAVCPHTVVPYFAKGFEDHAIDRWGSIPTRSRNSHPF